MTLILRILICVVAVVAYSCSKGTQTETTRGSASINPSSIPENSEGKKRLGYSSNESELKSGEFDRLSQIQQNVNELQKDQVRSDYEKDEIIAKQVINEDPLFSVGEDHDMETEFSEPIMITGANLVGSNSDSGLKCEDYSFSASVPSMRDVFDAATKQDKCGMVSVTFCLRTIISSSAVSESEPKYLYHQSPLISLPVACSEKSFADLDFSAGVVKEEGYSSFEFNVNFGPYVEKMAFFNGLGCEGDPHWKEVDGRHLVEGYSWGDEEFSFFSMKFMDIYERHSECVSKYFVKSDFTDIPKNDVDPPNHEDDKEEEEVESFFAEMPSIEFEGSGFTRFSSVDVLLSSNEAEDMLLTYDSECSSGGDWQNFRDLEQGWSILKMNAENKIYARFRNIDLALSDCVSASIIHDDIRPAKVKGLSLSGNAQLISESPQISWIPYVDLGSPVDYYQLSIGTSPDSTDVKSWTKVQDVSTFKMTGLALIPNQQYYVNIRVVDKAGNVGEVKSSDSFYLRGYSQAQMLKAVNIDSGDLFGSTVAISGDTVVVSAVLEDSLARGVTNDAQLSTDSSASLDSGAVYVYRNINGTWAQEAYIKSPNNNPNDYFGRSLAIDGDYLAVGVNDSSSQNTISNGVLPVRDSSLTASGAVVVYKRSNFQWQYEAFIKPSQPIANSPFGTAVAISGGTLVVGDHGVGFAMVYVRQDGVWVEQAKLQGGSTGSYFGWAVDIDGDLAVISIPRDGAGSADVFRRQGQVWNYEANIKGSNRGTRDEFGVSIAISGETIVVGAPKENGGQRGVTAETNFSGGERTRSGAGYVYEYVSGSWKEVAYLKALNADASDFFGASVDISGSTIVVGSPFEDGSQNTVTQFAEDSSDNSSSGSGAAYVFKKSSGSWYQDAYLKSQNTGYADYMSYYGRSNHWLRQGVSISGSTIVVGSPGEDSSSLNSPTDDSASQSGAAYIFD